MIKQIIEQIREQQALTKKELVDDPRTLNAQLGNIKRAEETLSQLFIDLRDEVKKQSIVILAKGKNAEKFSKIADESFGCLSFAAGAIFKQIAAAVDDSYLNKPASASIFDIAMSVMGDIAHEVGLVGYNYVQFKNEDNVQLNSRGDLEKLLSRAFNREIGAELVTLYAIHQASLKIMNSDFEGSRVPIVLHSDDSEMLDTIATDTRQLKVNVFIADSNGKVDEKMVEKQLTQINEIVQRG